MISRRIQLILRRGFSEVSMAIWPDEYGSPSKHSHQTVILIKGVQYQEKNEVTFNKFGHPEGTKMHLVLYS